MKNIWFLILGNAFGQSWPIRAVILFYFLRHGATEGQYQLVQWAMFWTLLLVEIPTGWLSDRWSRRKVLVWGAVFKLTGISLYAAGDGILWFFAGEQILALAKGFHSGTVQATLKETLDEVGRGHEYRKYSAWLDISGSAFQLIVVLAGGLIAMYSLRWTAYVSVGMSVLSLLCFLSIREPKRAIPAGSGPRSLRDAYMDVKSSFGKVWQNPVLWVASVSFAFVIAASQQLYALRQPYAVSVGLGQEWFGLLEASALGIMILGGWLARRSKPEQDRLWLSLIGLLLFGGMVAAGFLSSILPMIILLILVCLIRGCATFGRPIVDDIVQKEKIDKERATVLSIGSFLGYLVIAITGPFIQWMIEAGWSAPHVLGVMGLVCGILYATVLLTSKWYRRSV